MLSQLSYSPVASLRALSRSRNVPRVALRATVTRPSCACSPTSTAARAQPKAYALRTLLLVRCLVWAPGGARITQKEVIQPHLPIRLPCYDFTPVMNHTVVGVLLAVRLPASGAAHSHGVTGGVYKARERIHRGIADPRLLAIPTSRSRVADSDPDWDRLSGIGSTSRSRNPLYRPL